MDLETLFLGLFDLLVVDQHDLVLLQTCNVHFLLILLFSDIYIFCMAHLGKGTNCYNLLHVRPAASMYGGLFCAQIDFLSGLTNDTLAPILGNRLLICEEMVQCLA